MRGRGGRALLRACGQVSLGEATAARFGSVCASATVYLVEITYRAKGLPLRSLKGIVDGMADRTADRL